MTPYIAAVFEGTESGYQNACDYAKASNDLLVDDYDYQVQQWEVRK